MSEKRTWQERVVALMDRLEEVGAFKQWEAEDEHLIVQIWTTGVRPYVVQIWKDGLGWEVYVPIGGSSVKATLESIV